MTCFFPLRIALAILGLLWLHVTFIIICSSSVKNAMNNLTGITLNMYVALVIMAILLIVILPV